MPMKIYDIIEMCMRNLFRRKVRTLLTVVGVVVGTCAIVVMVSLGLGMQKSQEEMLSQMGDLTLIEIYAYNGGVDAEGNTVYLDDDMLSEIMKLDGVVTATPFYYGRYLNGTIYSGRNDRYTMYPNIVGVYPEALEALGFQLSEGDFETAFSEPYSVLSGQYTAYQFTDSRKKRGNNRVDPYPDATGEIPDPYVDIMEDKIVFRLDVPEGSRKREYTLNITGVLVEDYQRAYETSRGMFMDIEDMKKLEEEYIRANSIKVDDSASNKGYDNARVKVTDIDMVESVEAAIQEMGFDTYSMETIRKPMEEQTSRQQLFLGIIAGVSLFVAAIGIANTMLMSIYERTREIGVMKVVGCFVRDIRTVFLMEAGCIGFLGGVAGIAFSYLVSFLMNYFGLNIGMGSSMGMYMDSSGGSSVSIIPPWLALGALVFSTCIGLLSGYYPANRAVKISALTAIKQD